MIERARRIFSVLKERIGNKNEPSSSTFKKEFVVRTHVAQETETFALGELKVCFYLLWSSVLILCCKLLFVYRDVIRVMLVQKNPLTVLTENPFNSMLPSLGSMWGLLWNTLTVWSWLLVPVFAGAVGAAVAWNVMYFDSRVPGVVPPSPLSPIVRKRQAGRVFQLNYVFALISGFLLFVALLYNNLIN